MSIQYIKTVTNYNFIWIVRKITTG